MSHGPDESFLAWAKMQNWGETRAPVLEKRYARIMEMQPTPKDIRALTDWLEGRDVMVSVGGFSYYSKKEKRYKDSETADYPRYKFYFYPHNTEIIPFNGDDIDFIFYFDKDKNLVKASGSPTPHKIWATPADLLWLLLYRLVYWHPYQPEPVLSIKE
ncbi:MAG: hypothetical protein M3O22_08300 [Pseudomonadota bacterium]|nr:hypothetical protein [Pseudomonadota bacterium]